MTCKSKRGKHRKETYFATSLLLSGYHGWKLVVHIPEKNTLLLDSRGKTAKTH